MKFITIGNGGRRKRVIKRYINSGWVKEYERGYA